MKKKALAAPGCASSLNARYAANCNNSKNNCVIKNKGVFSLVVDITMCEHEKSTATHDIVWCDKRVSGRQEKREKTWICDSFGELASFFPGWLDMLNDAMA